MPVCPSAKKILLAPLGEIWLTPLGEISNRASEMSLKMHIHYINKVLMILKISEL